MKTTLNKIRAHSPCADGWGKLLTHLGKTQADDEPLSIATVIDSNDISDAIWCLRAVKGHDREMRLFALWCARRVEHLMSDPRSLEAIDVAERRARGRATDDELWMAAGAVSAVAWAWADAATRAAAAGAGADERTAQADELRRICREIEDGRDPYPEENGR